MEGNSEYFFVIDTDIGVIFQSFHGLITISEAICDLEKMSKHPDYRASFAVVTDLRDATFRASRQSFNSFYVRVAEILPAIGRKSAFVVTDPMISAFTLIFAKYSELTRDVRVFKNQESACDWLSQELECSVIPRFLKL